jgi:hypothetical protein
MEKIHSPKIRLPSKDKLSQPGSKDATKKKRRRFVSPVHAENMPCFFSQRAVDRVFEVGRTLSKKPGLNIATPHAVSIGFG